MSIGPYEISSITKRLVVKRVSETDVTSVCMVAPGLTEQLAAEQAQHIVDALNSFDAALRYLKQMKQPR